MSRRNDNYYALQYGYLVDHFRRPDGYKWSNSEVARASRGALSPAYLSQLSKGKYIQPGTDRLRAIADTVGFPVQLWYMPVSEWSSEIRNREGNSAAVDELLDALSDAEARQLLQQWRTLSAGHRTVVLNLVGTLNNIEDERDERDQHR